MRHDIEVAIDLLETALRKIGQIKEQARDFGQDGVYAQVDLGHAEHEVNRAIGYVNRLVVNGKKPWDEVQV